jgi:hypothetical protein
VHEEQWEGVHLKTKHAAFFLEEMGRAIRPPERTQWSIAAEASGAIIDTQWQRSFYPYLDAFLVMASVPSDEFAVHLMMSVFCSRDGEGGRAGGVVGGPGGAGSMAAVEYDS